MANNRETDLFGEVQWDEKAFPHAWVARMKGIINRRKLERLVSEELEYRGSHTVLFDSERPMTYDQMVKYDKFLRAHPDWTP